jgi:hypothetical protein
MAQFPLTVAAAKRLETDSWALGDALLTECGPPGMVGQQDGSYARIEAAARELLENDMEYDTRYLAGLRETSFRFPKNQRIVKLPWRVHHYAQTPEFLHSLVAGSQGTKITGAYVENMRRLQRDQERKAREAEIAAADEEEAEAKEVVRKATEKARTAKSERERQAAEAERLEAHQRAGRAKERRERNKVPPVKGRPQALDPAAIPVMAEVAGFLADAGTAKLLGTRRQKQIVNRLGEISPTSMAAMIEACLEVVNVWRELSATLEKRQKRGSHLYAVEQ